MKVALNTRLSKSEIEGIDAVGKNAPSRRSRMKYCIAFYIRHQNDGAQVPPLGQPSCKLPLQFYCLFQPDHALMPATHNHLSSKENGFSRYCGSLFSNSIEGLHAPFPRKVVARLSRASTQALSGFCRIAEQEFHLSRPKIPRIHLDEAATGRSRHTPSRRHPRPSRRY